MPISLLQSLSSDHSSSAILHLEQNEGEFRLGHLKMHDVGILEDGIVGIVLDALGERFHFDVGSVLEHIICATDK